MCPKDWIKHQLVSRFDISLHLATTIKWNDSRLANDLSCIGDLDPDVKDEIWKPNPYIYHLTSISTVPTMSGMSTYLAKSPSGFMWWMETIVKIQCPFDFDYFPFDVHNCKFKVTSLSSKNDTVLYVTERLVDTSTPKQKKKLPYAVQFEVFTKEEDLSIRSYSTCGFYIKLSRNVSSSLINVFVPSLLIVITSLFRNLVMQKRIVTCPATFEPN